MSRPDRFHPRAPGWLSTILLGMMVLAASPTGAMAASSVWELTPYRVRVVLCLAHEPEFTPGLERDLRTGLVNQCDLLIGPAWSVTFGSAPVALAEQMLGDVSAVSADSLPPPWLDDDKVALMTLSASEDGYLVTGRELDVRTRVFSPVIRVIARHPARLVNTLFWVLHRIFAPLAQIDSVDNGTAILRLRAAELPARDRAWLTTKPGTVFLPIFRFNDRDGKPRRVSPIQWTYFVVNEVSKAELKCKLQTGVASPLSGQRRGRVEQLALALLPTDGPTRLVLRSRTDKNKPLAGYEVYRQLGDSKSTAYLGRTDRRGAITLTPAGDATLRMLVIKNGDEILARLPVVLGAQPEVIAPISDDDQRLEAEGFITGFQENLIDLVTQREVLQSQIRARIRARELDKAEALLSTLRQMKGRDDCLNDLNREKQKIYSKDTVVQRKIDKLFGDTQTLLRQYLDPTIIERLVQELREARRGKFPAEASAGPQDHPAGSVSGSTGESTTPASPARPEASATKRG